MVYSRGRRRRQSSKTGPKDRFSTALIDKLSAWVQNEAEKDNVSWSFVVMNCVSFVSGIEAETYKDAKAVQKQSAKVISFATALNKAVQSKKGKSKKVKVKRYAR